MVSKYREKVNISPSNPAPSANEFNLSGVSPASQILKGMGDFARVAGVATKSYFDSEVAKDSIVQTQRAWRNELPTANATQGGKDAAAVVGMKLAVAKASSEYKALAEAGLSDEEFEEKSKELWGTTQEHISERYGVSEVGQEALALEFQKLMPSTVAHREAFKVKEEIRKQSEDATDMFILQSEGATVDDLKATGDTLLNNSKLSQEQLELSLTEAIMQAEDPSALIEYSKTVGEPSLYSSNKQLQKKDKAYKAQTAREDAAVTARYIEENDADYLSGDIDRATYEERVRAINDATGGSAYSVKSVQNVHIAATKAEKNEVIVTNLTDSLSDSSAGYVDTIGTTKKQQQEALTKLQEDYIADDLRIAEGMEDGPAKNNWMKGSKERVIRKVIADGYKMNKNFEVYKNALEAFTSMNVDANTVSEDNVISFNKSVKEFADTAESFPPEEYGNYVDGKTLKILNGYNTLVGQGYSKSEALKISQLKVRNSVPIDATVINEGAKNIVSDLNGWFSFDPVPDSQRSWLESLTRDNLAAHPDPSSGQALAAVGKWSKTQITQIDNKVLRGSPNFIAGAIGIHKDHISDYHEGTIAFYKREIQNKSELTGTDWSDAWVDIDPKTSMATIMLPPSYSTDIVFPASEMKGYKSKAKESRIKELKKAREQKEKLRKQIQEEASRHPTTNYNIKYGAKDTWNTLYR